MCSGRRRSNGRRIDMEKSPAALLRCRIIFVWGPNSPLAALILWRETTKFVIARRPQADVAISQCPAASRESYQRNRNCLHEIATALSGPRNDKSGAIAVLSLACTNRQRCAGPGCPLPYNALLILRTGPAWHRGKWPHGHGSDTPALSCNTGETPAPPRCRGRGPRA